MTPGRLAYTNYSYICSPCYLSIKLADLLPHWEDLV